ncbi:PIG-L family deacetylase [Ruegeria sp.]|uniref:PIG-L family deacetylase n=1 Tax=Ruegeria sp. TaxID=1879320 RepID=UPI003C7D887B
MTFPTYEQVLESQDFQEDLGNLNAAIAASLRAVGEPVAINGNALYTHMQEDFPDHEFSSNMEAKRLAIHYLAQQSKCFLEVGVAGGHAALLALHSNPSLTFIGVDLGQRLRPSWPAVDVFVPAAFEWFRHRFPDRVKLYRSDAIRGIRQAVAEQPFGPVDFVHLDAQKNTRFEELAALWPGLADRAYLMQGDNKNGHVRESSARMKRARRATALDDPVLRDFAHPTYEVLEIGPSIISGPVDLGSLEGQRILVCTAHQDDETLFAGSLLSHLKGKSQITVACFFRPAPNRRDTETREAALSRVCADLGAEYLQYPFAVEADHPRLRRFIQMPEKGGGELPVIQRPLRRHPLFSALAETVHATIQKLQPTVILTHNERGEYGHIEHVFLHHAVQNAVGRGWQGRLLNFGVGMPEADLLVPVDEGTKGRLFDEYLPQWDGRARYDFALSDEAFVDASGWTDLVDD